MRAGRLRHCINLKIKQQTGRGADGSKIVAWVMFAENVPAEILSVSGRETFLSQQEHARTDSKITIRELAGVIAEMRAEDVIEGTIYDICAVLPDPTRARHLLLLCESGVNQG